VLAIGVGTTNNGSVLAIGVGTIGVGTTNNGSVLAICGSSINEWFDNLSK
jgi:hypothetical protein